MIFEKEEDFKPKTRITKKDELDYQLIKRLASIQCSDHEIAYCIGVSTRSFDSWQAEDPLLNDALEEGRAKGKMSLRRAQFMVAFPDPDNGYRGNPFMLKWLGQQILHQSDKIEVGGSKEPIKIKLMWGDLPDNDNGEEMDACEEETKKLVDSAA